MRRQAFLGEKSIFAEKRFKCLNIIKQDCDDPVTYAGKVNQKCERFLLHELTIDMFKCLVFVKGLTDSKDKDISRILSKMDQDPYVSLQKVNVHV